MRQTFTDQVEGTWTGSGGEEVETPSFWKSFSACSRQYHNIIAYQ